MEMIEPSYAVIDVETSVNNLNIGSNKAHWKHKDNRVVLLGCLNQSNTAVVNNVFLIPPFPRLIVGHNVSFDLLHLFKSYPKIYNEWFPEGKIWDTAHIEYLLSGQESKFPSLDSLCTKYGLPLKDTRIREMWEAGVKTEDIPTHLLKEYNEQDVRNTHAIFLKQLKEVHAKDMMPLVKSQMDGLIALIEIEWNGMLVDTDRLAAYTATTKDKLVETEELVKRHIAFHTDIDFNDCNPNSVKQLNLALLGGDVEEEISMPITTIEGLPVLYKTGPNKGTPKSKKVIVTRYVPGAGFGIASWMEKTKNGLYSLDDNTLQYLIKTRIGTTSRPALLFIERILLYRELKKEVTTYIEGYSAYIWPDRYIHPTFNNTVTVTGRLSSSNPNMQNITRSED